MGARIRFLQSARMLKWLMLRSCSRLRRRIVSSARGVCSTRTESRGFEDTMMCREGWQTQTRFQYNPLREALPFPPLDVWRERRVHGKEWMKFIQIGECRYYVPLVVIVAGEPVSSKTDYVRPNQHQYLKSCRPSHGDPAPEKDAAVWVGVPVISDRVIQASFRHAFVAHVVVGHGSSTVEGGSSDSHDAMRRLDNGRGDGSTSSR
ncbi:hypothetical protein F5Y15DRAFT_140176 [Xylariaceae sp. FL0016]|nr:hypothetical protein F5Y15DRAFT_140176 [Xylariaceae sp. FL0016]